MEDISLTYGDFTLTCQHKLPKEIRTTPLNTTKEVHVVIKQSSFIITLSSEKHLLKDMNFDLTLIYDNETNSNVRYINQKPITFTHQITNPHRISFDIKIGVLSSQHEDMFFKILFKIFTESGELIGKCVSHPIRVISKADGKKKITKPPKTPAALKEDKPKNEGKLEAKGTKEFDMKGPHWDGKKDMKLDKFDRFEKLSDIEKGKENDGKSKENIEKKKKESEEDQGFVSNSSKEQNEKTRMVNGNNGINLSDLQQMTSMQMENKQMIGDENKMNMNTIDQQMNAQNMQHHSNVYNTEMQHYQNLSMNNVGNMNGMNQQVNGSYHQMNNQNMMSNMMNDHSNGMQLPSNFQMSMDDKEDSLLETLQYQQSILRELTQQTHSNPLANPLIGMINAYKQLPRHQRIPQLLRIVTTLTPQDNALISELVSSIIGFNGSVQQYGNQNNMNQNPGQPNVNNQMNTTPADFGYQNGTTPTGNGNDFVGTYYQNDGGFFQENMN